MRKVNGLMPPLLKHLSVALFCLQILDAKWAHNGWTESIILILGQ